MESLEFRLIHDQQVEVAMHTKITLGQAANCLDPRASTADGVRSRALSMRPSRGSRVFGHEGKSFDFQKDLRSFCDCAEVLSCPKEIEASKR